MTDVPVIEIKLYEMMAKRNIRTIEQLKEKTGLSRKAVSAALNNKNHRMHTDTIAKLCVALDCKISDLLVLKEGNK
ncbi:MAG: helix-turn-helix transcriptional regulator [Bacillota bacterium]|nr:helix-turn-helix transcriptional regulator [Bacillota bacterium]